MMRAESLKKESLDESARKLCRHLKQGFAVSGDNIIGRIKNQARVKCGLFHLSDNVHVNW